MSRLMNPGLPEHQPAAKRLRPSPGPPAPEEDPDSSAAHQGSMQHSHMQVSPRLSLLACDELHFSSLNHKVRQLYCAPLLTKATTGTYCSVCCFELKARLSALHGICSNSDSEGNNKCCRRCISQRL